MFGWLSLTGLTANVTFWWLSFAGYASVIQSHLYVSSRIGLCNYNSASQKPEVVTRYKVHEKYSWQKCLSEDIGMTVGYLL